MSVSERLNLIFSTITMVCTQLSVFIMLSELLQKAKNYGISYSVMLQLYKLVH